MTSNRRVFIGNLPPNVNEDDIRQEFSAYGNVTNVEIKQKKDCLNEDQANRFAFINVDIDTWSLNKCIQEFTEQEWKGRHLKVALAKESFLEQLQRERQEAQALNKKVNNASTEKNHEIIRQPIEVVSKPLVKPVKKCKVIEDKNKFYKKSSSSEESSSSDESEQVENKELKKVILQPDSIIDSDFVIKSNKHNSFLNPEKLKIPTFGPAIISQCDDNSRKNLTPQALLAEQKRKQSLLEKKQQYNKQKMVLQKSFLKIDKAPKNKIVFDDEQFKEKNNEKNGLNNKRPEKRGATLFGENEDDDEINYHFDLKEQFQGKEGQKLLKLQSTFSNDKRFALDSRFLDDDDTSETKINDAQDPESLEDEKRHQFEILENVLGQRIGYNKEEIKKDVKMKSMLRYDPSKPDHNKFLNKDEGKIKSKSKVQSKVDGKNIDKTNEDKEPLVSKEKFYSVPKNLKEAIKENTGFSLLSMFGTANVEIGTRNADDDYTANDAQRNMNKIISNPLDIQNNPFHYDSSDSEEENNGAIKSKEKLVNNNIGHMSNTGIWRENFFFIKDDQRLLDGIKFFTTFSSTNDSKKAFNDTRRELKKVVKYKVLNNLRNAKPFKRKLGGHKRKLAK